MSVVRPTIPWSSSNTSARQSSDTLQSVLSLVQQLSVPPKPHVFPADPTGPSLAPEDGRAELHYISSHAFSDTTFSVADEHVATHPGDVSFRQVSNDHDLPVFFVQTPSLMYGTAAPAARRLYDAALSALTPDAPQRLVEIYLRQTQPALPILDDQATSDIASLQQRGISYGVLTSLLAHSTSYVHEIRPAHKHLWRQVLLSLEDGYRQPTLQTLQQALVTISSRPAINLAQNHIAMGRLTSAAQLLGLHIDPSRWRIPELERRLRKRLWWAVLITDKWRALWYGRPSNIARDDWNVPLPLPSDFAAADASSQSYIAWCRLTLIVDAILRDFFTVRATSEHGKPSDRLALLEKAGAEVASLERDLPFVLTALPGVEAPPTTPAPTGVRSFQLCKLGVEMTLLRLTMASLEKPSPEQLVLSSRTALALVQTIVEFLEHLRPEDYGAFWAPYCSFIISAAGALLIRTAMTASAVDPTTRTACGVLFTRLVVTLTSSHHAARWDVASLALDRIATLLRSLNGDLPELIPLLQLFGPPNHANTAPPSAGPSAGPLLSPTLARPGVPPSAAPAPAILLSPSHPAAPQRGAPAAPPPADQLTSPQSELDAWWWMNSEILSLPDHLGAVADVFEGWPAFDDLAGSTAGSFEGAAGGQTEGPGTDALGWQPFDLRSFLEGPGAMPWSGAGVQPGPVPNAPML
ncbi:fungal specific transcription factor domain-containing protein [Rhodotorula paludigena]|uniref:fungal specific transcription factor domain-containing protein n=1 Tax=Rhodotorula paludigena TaxID=86838 RepID=UPI00317FA7C6